MKHLFVFFLQFSAFVFLKFQGLNIFGVLESEVRALIGHRLFEFVSEFFILFLQFFVFRFVLIADRFLHLLF